MNRTQKERESKRNKLSSNASKIREIYEQRIQRAILDQGKHLDLEGLGLSELPIGFPHRELFFSLDLSNNEFTDLPNEICELTQLQSLNISNNGLFFLPDRLY
jgi:Leucine-rich repeat (LRR) protein